MMNTFDIPKNLIAIIGALTLAMMMAASPSAFAEEVSSPEDQVSVTNDFVFGDGDLAQLRELLSTPALSDEQRLHLQRTLDTLHEEIA